MKFAAILKSLLLLTATSVLVACGGGSSGGDSVFQPSTIRITASPSATTVRSGESIDVKVKVTQANGANVADGTVVNSTMSPASNGSLYSMSNGVAGGSSGTTVGGVANFVFAANGSGNTTLTFSTADGSGRSVAAVVNIDVQPAPDTSWRLNATAESTSLPANTSTPVTVRLNRADGTPVPDGTIVRATTTPAGSGSVVTADSGGDASNESATVAGIARFYFLAGATPGESLATFSASDPDQADEMVTGSIQFTITSALGHQMDVELVPEIIPLNGGADVRVRVLQPNGQAVADGTEVVATAFPGSLGAFDQAVAETVAGYAAFSFQAQGKTGDVEMIFSASPSNSSHPVVTSATLVIAEVDDSRLQLQATRTTLPVNLHQVLPFMGSPYMAEVTVTVKDSNGQPINMEDGIQVSINPVGNTGGFSMLDDPETECDDDDIPWEGCNEFLTRMGQAPVDVVAGKATLFVHSLDFTGLTTLTVTTQDPVSGTTIAAALEFEIVATTPATPSQLTLSTPDAPIYVQGSGGNGSGSLEVGLFDALGQPVPDPEAGANAYNNYRLEIIGANPEQTPRLNGINAAGVSVSGSQVDLRTTAGIGGANFIAGDGVGSFVIRLTADRADNNIDNGISDPVYIERSIVVSDGQLYDLEITQPSVNALTINPAGGDIEVVDLGAGEITIPVSPDGTYSVTVAVIATDRQGNPVLPGTRINFGLIDEPQATGVGDFYIAGGDGNPQEGGTAFTAVSGRFMTAGGGVGAGDTLVVFAEDVIGNRDLESARAVTQVHSNTSLSVDYRFNHNDTTGQTVDYGGILPYVIGRAADGNIVASATTNEMGVAVTKMNYPIEKLGKLAVIWAQADGPVVAGQPKKVADVEYAYFAGVAPARLVVSPAVLPANTTADVTICTYDALSAAMGGVSVGFAFADLLGVGEVDGVDGSGQVGGLTSFEDGCVIAEVSTRSALEGEGDARLIFSALGASAEVSFSFQPLVLLANPSAMTSGGTVTLTLLNDSGQPQPGIQIVGSCTSAGGAVIGIVSGPGTTNSVGKTTAVIDAFELNQVGGAGSGSCTFSTADGSATAVVNFQGSDMCSWGVSPPIPGCP